MLNATVKIRQDTQTDDGAGGFTETATDIHAVMPCRMQPMRGDELTMAGQLGIRATWKLYTEQSGLQKDYYVVTDDGTEYEITYIAARSGGSLDHYELWLLELDRG